MNEYKKLFIISCSVFLLSFPLVSNAQTVDASPEVSNICFGATAPLTATYSGPVVTATTDYTISSIAYNPDPLSNGTAVTLSDDTQTGLLPIGFTFCFFGNSYTQFIIGSNNWIGFQAGETSTWVTAPIPNTNGTTTPRNTIMGAWQDINPGIGGTVKYALYGTAPNRRLAVSWYNVPMFSCTGQLYSSQIIIYETTNIIETHILNKSLCTTWNSGNAVHGLHNSTGTVAVVVPGRNNTQWTASNEGKRFTPSGPATSTVNWYILPTNALVGTGTAISVTPPVGQATTMYYAQVVSTGTCVSGFGRDTVVVNQTNCAPCTTTAGNNGPVCVGSAINLTSTTTSISGVASYSWTGPNGFTSSVQNPVISTSTLLSAGTYSLTVTENNGSFCSTTTTVVVNPYPPAPAASNNGPICSGGTLDLSTPVTGVTYNWTGPNSFSSTVQNPSISPATNTATGTYFLTVTVNGCTSAAGTTSVLINNTPNPPIPLINGSATPASICSGTNIVLTANNIAGASYHWTGPNGFTSSVRNPPALINSTPAMSGTYSLSVTVGNCTSLPATVSIVVNPMPVTPTISSTGICAGMSTTLTASGSGPVYEWFTTASGGTLIDTGATFTTPVLMTTTTYYVQSNGGGGCIGPRIGVTVTVTPAFTVVSFPDDTICSGDSFTLGVISPTTGYTYSWDAPSDTAFSTIATPIVTPSVTTTYTVTLVAASGGCVGSDSITVVVGTPYTISSSGSPATCFGACNGTGTTTVTGSFPPYIYSWTNGSTSQSVGALCAGTYSVTIFDRFGCTTNDTIMIDEPTAITVTASSVAAHCNQPDGSAAVMASGGVPPYTYLWNPGSQTTDTAKLLIPGNYCVRVTDANGCYKDICITVNDTPGVTATASATSTTCNLGCDGSATVTASSGTLPYTYLWSNGETTTTTSNSLCAATYTVVVTDSTGCTFSATASVSEPTPVQVSNVAASVSTICIGQSSTLTATATGGSPGYTYSWTPSAGTGSSITVSPTATTAYSVTATDASGCTSTVPGSINVNVNLPLSVSAGTTVTDVCEGANVGLAALTSSGGDGNYTYTWMPGSLNGSSVTVVPTPAGLVSYTVTMSDNCGTPVTTSTVTLNVHPKPTVGFTVDPYITCAPTCVTFTDNSTAPPLETITPTWYIDGAIIGSSPTYCFNTGGVHTVKLLEVTSTGGCADSVQQNDVITVYDMPVASFTYDPQPASLTNPEITFTDQSVNATTWNWDFDDADLNPTTNSSVVQNPHHIYSDGELMM
jgi:PKD repeat protein